VCADISIYRHELYFIPLLWGSLYWSLNKRFRHTLKTAYRIQLRRLLKTYGQTSGRMWQGYCNRLRLHRTSSTYGSVTGRVTQTTTGKMRVIQNGRVVIYIAQNVSNSVLKQIPGAARSKAWVWGRTLAEIAGSNPAGAWMSVCCECCVLSRRSHCVGLVTRPEISQRVSCF